MWNQTKNIFNILENCPSLKSVKIIGLSVVDPQSIHNWYAFLFKMYNTFDAYIDIFYNNWRSVINLKAFEKYLKKIDLGAYDKYAWNWVVLVKKETIIDVIDSLLNRSAKQKPIQKYQTLNCQDSYVKQNRSLKWVAVIQLIQNYTVLKSHKKV